MTRTAQLVTRKGLFLQRLLTRVPDVNNPRASQSDLARWMNDHSENADWFKQLPACVFGATIPEAHSSVLLGEGLRENGCLIKVRRSMLLDEGLTESEHARKIPWVNLILMLWLCGHYAVAIHILALWLRHRAEHNDWVRFQRLLPNLICAPLTKSDLIFAPHPYDHEVALLRAHLLTRNMDGTTWQLLCQRDPYCQPNMPIKANDDCPSVSFVRRERAKAAWSKLSDFMPEIYPIAVDIAPPRKPRDRDVVRAPIQVWREESEHDRLVTAMIEIGKSTTIPLDAQEAVLVQMLSRWISGLMDKPTASRLRPAATSEKAATV